MLIAIAVSTPNRSLLRSHLGRDVFWQVLPQLLWRQGQRLLHTSSTVLWCFLLLPWQWTSTRLHLHWQQLSLLVVLLAAAAPCAAGGLWQPAVDVCQDCPAVGLTVELVLQVPQDWVACRASGSTSAQLDTS